MDSARSNEAASPEAHASGLVVYALIDPRDGSIRYVGQTQNLEKRLAAHASEGRRTVPHPNENPRKCEWLRELRRAGLSFGVCVLERSDRRSENCASEEWWIETGCALDWPLTNRIGKRVRDVVAAITTSAAAPESDPSPSSAQDREVA